MDFQERRKKNKFFIDFFFIRFCTLNLNNGFKFVLLFLAAAFESKHKKKFCVKVCPKKITLKKHKL